MKGTVFVKIFEKGNRGAIKSIYLVEGFRVPPCIWCRLNVRSNEALHKRSSTTNQRPIAVSPFQHTDNTATRVLLRKCASILGKPGVKCSRNVSVMTRHV